MADFISSPMAGGFGRESSESFSVKAPPNRLTTFTNLAGAVVSLALVIGIGVWGYKLLVRDVSGIPVVRAVAGEMRVRPNEPGGELAQHQGLSVNVIAANGTAGRPADELRLAPSPVDLTEDDQIIPVAMVAPAPQDPLARTVPAAAPVTLPAPITTDVTAALESGNVDDLVAQLTANVTPMADLAADPEEVAATIAAEVAEAVVTPVAAIDAPGVRQSLRPKRRPATRAVVVQASLNTPAPSAAAEVDATSLKAGTRLAQLGAFDSPEVAREQWDVLQGRFSAFLGDKQRIVQKATSGGRVFYRLRAMGFQDIADARRFCAALVAENADCIPVVTR